MRTSRAMPLREQLVAQAAAFLRSPNAEGASAQEKENFLRQKGLSQEERWKAGGVRRVRVRADGTGDSLLGSTSGTSAVKDGAEACPEGCFGGSLSGVDCGGAVHGRHDVRSAACSPEIGHSEPRCRPREADVGGPDPIDLGGIRPTPAVALRLGLGQPGPPPHPVRFPLAS